MTQEMDPIKPTRPVVLNCDAVCAFCGLDMPFIRTGYYHRHTAVECPNAGKRFRAIELEEENK